jgi:ATP-dependent DNA helicase 2 subunit 2
MKDVNVFIPEPGKARAALAVSALARAMKEMNKVAILRCVWRQGQGSVVVGVLTPNISEKDSTVGFSTCFGASASHCLTLHLAFVCCF